MSAATTSSRTSTIVGILVGLVLLGLMAAFAIGLPKAADAEEPAVVISLPDTLPGGFAAADEPASFEDGELAAQADAIAQQQAASTAYGNEILPEVLDTAAATRSYVVNGTEAVFVQVFQSEGGAFSPTSLTDPESTNGGGGTTMQNVGDGVCILTFGQSEPGQPAGPSSSQCQVSQGELTVQASSNQVVAEDLVQLADDLLELQDQ